MKYLKYSAILSVLLIVLHNVNFALNRASGSDGSDSALPARLIIKLENKQIGQDNYKTLPNATAMADLDKLNSKLNIVHMNPLIDRINPRYQSAHFEDVYIIELSNGQDIEEIMAEYENLPGVAYVEEDQVAHYYDSPNDALYGQQWYLNNTGQEYYQVKRIYGSHNDQLILGLGEFDADIDADEVYQNPPDKTAATVVAILDTGVDMTHPDLADNIWNNPGEIPNDLIDNDFNGFVDDIHGWNFGGNLTDIGVGDNDPSDDDGHGTHVAGIVAAVANNNIGIRGVADSCQIMALSIDPIPFVSIIARAIIYAADNGADVINMSFGLYTRSDLVEDALSYARSKGVILIAAAGNDGAEQYNYPAASELVMAIGATNDKDNVTSFSTYGSQVNLCAPGQSILSLRATNTDLYAPDGEPGVHIVDDLYILASGTSMSSPMVVGAAAYLRSVSPGLTPDKALDILEQTADDLIDPYGAGWNLPGYDIYSGYGRLNLNNALQAVPKIRAEIQSPDYFDVVSDTVNILGTADGDDFSGYTLSYGQGKEPTTWNNIIFSSSPVTDNSLINWNTTGMNGLYTLRLAVGTDNIDYKTVYVANDNAVEILYPQTNDMLTGITTVRGNAFGPEFKSYRLEYRPSDQIDAWQLINNSSVLAFDNYIGEWSTGELAEGEYILRLTVTMSDDSEIHDEITVNIESIFSTNNAWKVPLEGQTGIIPNYGDFDNDGNNEIIVGTSSGIFVYNTDGTIKIDNLPDFPENNFMIPIAVGDLDGDDIDDIVALGYNPPIVYSYPSSSPAFINYLANFPELNFSGSEHAFSKLFLKDIDNDGRDEIIVYMYNRTKPLSFIIASDGSFQKMFEYTSEFLSADLNGDGLDEIYSFQNDFSSLRRLDIDDNILDEKIIESDDRSFSCQGLSAGDIDYDGKLELIVFGYFNDGDFAMYAYNENFLPVPGWPRDLGIDPFVLPTVPIFGDFDKDSQLEYFCTFFDLDISYIMAWNLDGTSLLPGSPDGHFAVTPQLGIANMLLLNDMNNDKIPDIVACANDDPFSFNKVQRIYAWGLNSELLNEFPIIMAPNASTGFRHTPSIGDINNDGFVDMIMTTADNELAFVNLPGQTYRECASPVGHWRYNRRMNNIVPEIISCDPSDINDEQSQLPTSLVLNQNYPNPFNPLTTISFSLPEKSQVSLSIYNVLGQQIICLIDESLPAGRHSIEWNGKDFKGEDVASGIYLYRFKTDKFTETRKMILLK